MICPCERSLTAQDWARARIGPVLHAERVRSSVWSTVERLDAEEGCFYLKEVSCALAHEPALTHALSRWVPGHTPRVIAHDVRHGWLLLADEGDTLRSRGGDFSDAAREYGLLQQRLVSHTDAMRLMGAPDRRLEVLPGLYRCLLEEDLGLSPSELATAHDLLPSLVRRCHELAAYGIPETLHHDDLHDGNVLVRDNAFVFADWGECAVGHPFLSSALMTINTPEVCEAYLSAFGDPAELRTPFALAVPLGMLCRSLTWQRILAATDDPGELPERDKPGYWFRRYLAAVTTNPSTIASERM